jgi:hypothetical protein
MEPEPAGGRAKTTTAALTITAMANATKYLSRI